MIVLNGVMAFFEMIYWSSLSDLLKKKKKKKEREGEREREREREFIAVIGASDDLLQICFVLLALRNISLLPISCV